VVKSSVKFNYNGSEKRHLLPEGCISPVVDTREHDTPCEHGRRLGLQLVTDIIEMAVRKLLFHVEAVSNLESETIYEMSTDRLDEMVERVPELIELLDDIKSVEREKGELTPIRVDEHQDGSKVETYVLEDQRTVVKTMYPDKRVQVLTNMKDGGTTIRQDSKDKTSEIIRKDASGKILWIQTIQPDLSFEDYEKVQIFTAEKKPVGLPFDRLMTRAEAHHEIEIPEDIYFAFSESTNFFVETVQEYILERLKCFVRSIVPSREDYLVFVCASLDKDQIQKNLVKIFQKTVVCKKKVDCDAVEERILTQLKLYVEFGSLNI
jgi:hypothetical protein